MAATMKLNALTVRILNAQEAMEKYLRQQYPVGTTVRCMIMYGQVNPSIGDVISHPGGANGMVRLRLHSRTKHVVDVSAKDIR